MKMNALNYRWIQSVSGMVALATWVGMAQPVEAKPKREEGSTGTYGCARFDVNQNGILDEDEKAALLKAFEGGDPALKLLDTNNNGKLDESELGAIKLPAPKKGKKKG
jgi:hypothetical protein